MNLKSFEAANGEKTQTQPPNPTTKPTYMDIEFKKSEWI